MGYAPKSRARTSPPAAAISSSSQSRLIAAMSCATSSETANPLVRSALPMDEDAPHEVVGRLLQRRAVAVRDRAEVQPHAGPVLGTTRAGRSLDMAAGGYPRHPAVHAPLFIRSG